MLIYMIELNIWEAFKMNLIDILALLINIGLPIAILIVAFLYITNILKKLKSIEEKLDRVIAEFENDKKH